MDSKQRVMPLEKLSFEEKDWEDNDLTKLSFGMEFFLGMREEK